MALCISLAATPSLRATDITWINGAGGDWNTAANWNPSQVPGPADKAILALAVTVTLDSSATVSNLDLSNGALSGSGTVTVSGTLSGGNYTLEGGFWPGIVLPSSTGVAPTLSIQLSDNNVVVSWPSPSTGFVLQQTASLGTPAWNNVVQTPGDNGAIKGVTLTLSPGGTFYRLMKP